MASEISMISAEYQVRAITGDEFIIIYICGSTMVEACLARFLCMFKSSKDEWVAGLDVEYTTSQAGTAVWRLTAATARRVAA